MTGFYVKLKVFPKRKSYLSIQIFLRFLIIRDIIIHLVCMNIIALA